jgi:hypothetical protein
MVAALYGHVSLTEELLKRGADPELVDKVTEH